MISNAFNIPKVSTNRNCMDCAHANCSIGSSDPPHVISILLPISLWWVKNWGYVLQYILVPIWSLTSGSPTVLAQYLQIRPVYITVREYIFTLFSYLSCVRAYSRIPAPAVRFGRHVFFFFFTQKSNAVILKVVPLRK